jgi:hypothetical protein
MAVNVYDELSAHAARLAALEARVAKLEAALAPKLKLAVPSYWRPDTVKWPALLALRPDIVCINPGNGPGPTPSTTYPAQVAAAKTAGARVLGYVHTQYAARPIAEVKADAKRHLDWYGVTGIFVDTTSVKAEHTAYYEDLCAYLRGLGLFVCLNPGTRCPERLAQIADAVMVAENTLSGYVAHAHAAWEKNYPGKLWHAVPEADMPTVVALARARGAGYLYVTPDLLPNPWDTLSPYAAALAAELAR